MGSGSCSSSSCLHRLFCCRTLAVFGFFCLLVVGSLGSGRATTKPTTLSSTSLSSQETLKHKHDIGSSTSSDKSVNHEELDFNYMSKRRVPNGPDPIHNRRAGNSGRPPGQA